MSSAALWTAVAAWLVGDSGDVRTTVNAEQTGLLVAGSVYAAREAAGAAARKANALPLAVEVELLRRASRVVGIGFEEVDLVVGLSIRLRKKATTPGATQLSVVESVARALARRYAGATNLGITVTGATFVRAAAEVTDLDVEPDEGELEAGLVTATFTFLEDQAANT